MAREKSLIDPNDSDELDNGEIKQAVINAQGKRTTHLRIAGVRGVFGPVVFGEDYISTTPVPEEVREKLVKSFPNTKVEEIAAVP